MRRNEEILKHVMSRDAALVEKSLHDINPEVFDLAVETIARAKHIYILGVRSCAPLAEYLGFYLNQIFPDVRIVRTNSASDIFEQMLHLSEKDVVIGISFPRYSMRVLKAMEYANSRSAGIVTITDTRHSPICLYSSCNLFAETDMSSIVDSMTAPLSLINALVVALCSKKRGAVLKNLQDLQTIWADYPTNTEDEMNPVDPNTRMKTMP